MPGRLLTHPLFMLFVRGEIQAPGSLLHISPRLRLLFKVYGRREAKSHFPENCKCALSGLTES